MTRTNRLLREYLPPLLVLATIIIVWEWMARTSVSPKFSLMAPAPSRIVQAALENKNDTGGNVLLKATLNSFKYASMGFALSLIVGNLIAFFMSLARFVERSVYPYAIFLQTVPIVAIAPILVLWIGAGPKAIVAISFIISLFPVITNTASGLTRTPNDWIELMQVYDANWWQQLCKLRIPAAVPYMVTGAKISAGLPVVGAIVGEYFTALSTSANDEFGLAYLLESSQSEANFPYLFAVAIASAVMGLCIFILVSVAGSLILKLGHFEERKL